VAEGEEARAAAAFGLERVARAIVVGAAARVRDEVGAASERAAGPGVDEVEGQRRVHADARVQRARQLPGAVADARDVLAGGAGGMQVDRVLVARDDVALGDEVLQLEL